MDVSHCFRQLGLHEGLQAFQESVLCSEVNEPQAKLLLQWEFILGHINIRANISSA